MFFTRRYQDKLDRLERKVASLEAELRVRDITMEAHIELVKSFQKLQDQYTDGLNRARQAMDDIQAAVPTFSNEPLYSTEEEEDLEARLQHGLIDDEDYRRALSGLVPNITIDR